MRRYRLIVTLFAVLLYPAIAAAQLSPVRFLPIPVMPTSGEWPRLEIYDGARRFPNLAPFVVLSRESPDAADIPVRTYPLVFGAYYGVAILVGQLRQGTYIAHYYDQSSYPTSQDIPKA